jgi:AraC-like DNA-binding protein
VVSLDEGGRGRSGTRLVAPDAALEPWIEQFWIQRGEREPANRNWRIVPDANAHVIFAAESAHSGYRTRLLLVGARGEFEDIDMSARRITTGARLRLGTLAQLTRSRADVFMGRGFRMDEIFGSSARALADRMSECSPEEAQRQLRLFLENQLAKCEPDLRFEQALQSAGKVEWLGQTMGCSPRALYTRSVDAVGIGPKHLLRIMRLHRALRLASSGRRAWADISYGAGFADQAHMVREFRSLLGDTPNRWRRRSTADLFNTQRAGAR